MRDMKSSFTLANPSLTGLDWSFMSEISYETQLGDGVVFGNGEEGEVVRGCPGGQGERSGGRRVGSHC